MNSDRVDQCIGEITKEINRGNFSEIQEVEEPASNIGSKLTTERVGLLGNQDASGRCIT